MVDLLGTQGEEAKENVEKMSDQLELVESHLHAVDSALQDFMQKSGHLLEDTYSLEEEELQELGKVERMTEDERWDIDELQDRVESLDRQVSQMKKIQQKNKQKLDAILDSELLDIMGRVRKLINTTNKRYYDLRDSLKSMEDRINELENDFIMEVNNREFDFEKKLNKRKFEDRDEEIQQELAKLRASISILAEDADKKDEIKIEDEN